MDTNAISGSGCNTIPSGVTVDPRSGAVYALWLSGNDVFSNVATGCNYSQIGPFDKAWVSASTDGGAHWTAPFKVNAARGSYFFPWIAAGAGGVVDAIFYRTDSLRPNDPSDR